MPDIVTEPTATPTPSAAPTATPSAPAAAPTVAAPSPAPATGGAPSAGTTPSPPSDDSPAMVPSYRLRQTREAAVREAQQQWAQKEADYQARLDQVQSQLRALVGVQPPQNPEVEAVRQQFAQLYPKLAKLEERGDDVFGLLERAPDLNAQIESGWNRYGQEVVNRLFKSAETVLGSPLTEEGKAVLHQSFVGFVQSSPEMLTRYADDPTIADDFVKAFSSNFIDPARRSATASVQGRATTPLPQDTPAGVPRPTPGPQPSNLDERAALGFAQYQQLTNKS